eukprot:1158253-Pelagomonas_calceolata.AAC.6
MDEVIGTARGVTATGRQRGAIEGKAESRIFCLSATQGKAPAQSRCSMLAMPGVEAVSLVEKKKKA